MAADDVRDERISRRRTRNRGDVMTRLFGTWMWAGTNLLTGSLRVAADMLEDTIDEFDRRPRRRNRSR
jgi:hypothetical protein